MAKKLIKYGKFLMSVALIFSLVMPSYAALSNTDGSSFVTKAEFDSALADFNSRLTTFEAGINSKIDSQVSSYLDRNGIWAAKAQTIKNDTTANFGFKATATAALGVCYNGGNDGIIRSTLLTTGPVVSLGNGVSTVIVEKTNKAGLCCIDYYHDIGDDGELTCFFGGRTVVNQDFIGWNFTQQWNFYADTELKAGLTNFMIVAYPGTLKLNSLKNGRLLFFIDKEKKITEKNELFEKQNASQPPYAYSGSTSTYLYINKVEIY